MKTKNLASKATFKVKRRPVIQTGNRRSSAIKLATKKSDHQVKANLQDQDTSRRRNVPSKMADAEDNVYMKGLCNELEDNTFDFEHPKNVFDFGHPASTNDKHCASQ